MRDYSLKNISELSANYVVIGIIAFATSLGVEYDCIIYKFRYLGKSSCRVDVIVVGDGNCFDLKNNKDIYLKDVVNACIRSEKVVCISVGGILVFGIVLVCLLVFKNKLDKRK